MSCSRARQLAATSRMCTLICTAPTARTEVGRDVVQCTGTQMPVGVDDTQDDLMLRVSEEPRVLGVHPVGDLRVGMVEHLALAHTAELRGSAQQSEPALANGHVRDQRRGGVRAGVVHHEHAHRPPVGGAEGEPGGLLDDQLLVSGRDDDHHQRRLSVRGVRNRDVADPEQKEEQVVEDQRHHHVGKHRQVDVHDSTALRRHRCRHRSRRRRVYPLRRARSLCR